MFMSVTITLFIVSKTEVNPISLEAITNASIYFVFLMDTFIFWTISFLRFLSINKPIYRVKPRSINILLLIEVFVSFLTATAIFAILIAINSSITSNSINFILTIVILLVAITGNVCLNVSSLIILRRSTNSKSQNRS